jgi:hypothetical protein
MDYTLPLNQMFSPETYPFYVSPPLPDLIFRDLIYLRLHPIKKLNQFKPAC